MAESARHHALHEHESLLKKVDKELQTMETAALERKQDNIMLSLKEQANERERKNFLEGEKRRIMQEMEQLTSQEGIIPLATGD